MKIIVLVKEVPDTYGDRKLDLETGLADRAASDTVLDEIGERAVEAALAYADGHADTDIVVLSMAPAGSAATVRKGLQMGASSAVHVADDALHGADLGLTAQVLAAAIGRTGFDLVIAGNQSTDGSGGVIPAMLAELLDVPLLSGLAALELTDTTVSGPRGVDAGVEHLTAALPAIVSITEALPDARLANFKGIMAAKKKPFETLTLADLGVDADDLAVPRTIMTEIAERPARAAGVKIVDEGDAGTKLAEFLVQNRLV